MGFERTVPLLASLAVLMGLSYAATAAELVKYQVVKEGIAQSLTGTSGDAKTGRKTAIDRKKGNCLACHKLPVPEQPFHGEIGPDLAGVASRLTAAEIRLRIVDPKVVNADTFMPAFYRTTGLHRVQKKWQGKTIIGAQDVEDIVAYLQTLKE